MLRKKSLISYVLLVIFGMLILKNLLPLTSENNGQNCEEFAHIHLYQTAQKFEVYQLQTPKPLGKESNSDCHSGKSIFGYSLFPVGTPEITAIEFPSVSRIFSSIENNYKNPFIEPHRKPPRSV